LGNWVVPVLASILVLGIGLYDNSAFGQIGPGGGIDIEIVVLDLVSVTPIDITIPTAGGPISLGTDLTHGDLIATLDWTGINFFGTDALIRVNSTPNFGEIFLDGDPGGEVGLFASLSFVPTDLSEIDEVRFSFAPETEGSFFWTFSDGPNFRDCFADFDASTTSPLRVPINNLNCTTFGPYNPSIASFFDVFFEIEVGSGVTVTGVTLASSSTSGLVTTQATITQTCGLTVNTATITYDAAGNPLLEDQISDEETISITKTGGALNTQVLVLGTPWQVGGAGATIVNVGETHFGNPNGVSAGYATDTPLSLVNQQLAPPGFEGVNFLSEWGLRANTVSGTFEGLIQQTVTFSVVCP